jgi:uncharacterized protein YeaO (DUF488 family)
MKTIKIKRIYETASKGDGYRILIDRLWPRGLAKTVAAIDLWLKEISPTNELRKWFNHDPQKWTEFKERYFIELAPKKELINTILEKSHTQSITLLYGAKDEKHNNAVALKEYLNNVRTKANEIQ